MEVTLGGNRLGSGGKQKEHLPNYGRSTHNLSKSWASTMASGILYPAWCVPVMRGDNFTIDLKAAARTIPTQGPLFGSFKLQIDVFQCPMRLYQGILHNNPQAIGLKMNQVKFPMLDIWTNAKEYDTHAGEFAPSSLLKYLGMSGLGRNANVQTSQLFGRDIWAIPALAYYDIFKNYYANKQEEKAYVISQNLESAGQSSFQNITFTGLNASMSVETIYLADNTETFGSDELYKCENWNVIVEGSNLYTTGINLLKVDTPYTIEELQMNGVIKSVKINEQRTIMQFSLNTAAFMKYLNLNDDKNISADATATANDPDEELHLIPFDLANIDEMRYQILSHNRMNDTLYIKQGEDTDILPYSTLVAQQLNSGETMNKISHNGLVVKTYQSDLFNNWINSEWIDGEDGVAELSKIAVEDDAVYVDAILFGEKVYNMFNRIALAGNTYEDWQDAVYDKSQKRYIEAPVYLGGYEDEVVFEEIVQTAPAGDTTLGTLGGRGTLLHGKGGHINVRIDEASVLIAIVSLTPRIYQTQGNKWYMTDIKTMDDLHKPALDGIGFQDLIGEQMAWWDTVIEPDTKNILYRSAIGKVPAWINYRTDVDEAYGDFATGKGEDFMILSRGYEMENENNPTGSHAVKDFTTYIDPKKYNYAFAYTKLDAQNFWVQIKFNVKARRKMSTSLIPKA